MPVFYDRWGIKVDVEEICSPLPLVTGWYFVLSLSCPTVHLERPRVTRKGLIIMPVEMFQRWFSLQEIGPLGNILLLAFRKRLPEMHLLSLCCSKARYV